MEQLIINKNILKHGVYMNIQHISKKQRKQTLNYL